VKINRKSRPWQSGYHYAFFLRINIPVPYAINPYIIPQKIHASILAIKVLIFVVINNNGNKKERAGAKYILLEMVIMNSPKIAATAGIIPIASKKGFTSI
jgi:hypothetical protein